MLEDLRAEEVDLEEEYLVGRSYSLESGGGESTTNLPQVGSDQCTCFVQILAGRGARIWEWDPAASVGSPLVNMGRSATLDQMEGCSRNLYQSQLLALLLGYSSCYLADKL